MSQKYKENSHFYEHIRIFCQNYVRRILYELKHFKNIILYGTFNLTIRHGFHKVAFPSDILTFKDESKILCKFVIFPTFTKYSTRIIAAKYSMTFEICILY